MTFVLALAVAAQAPAAAAPAQESFALTCSVVGQENGRARFSIVAAGIGEGRRFAIRPQGESRWIGEISAASVRGRDYHFVSGGTAYRLALGFDAGGAPQTARAELEEDRGFPALNVKLAQGSCRPLATAAGGEIPALPEAPLVRGEAPPHRPVQLPEGRVPSDCTIVLRDLSEVTFGLEATFDPAGIQFLVTPAAGQAWPTSALSVRGAMLAAIARPPGGPPGGVLTVFGEAGRGAKGAGPAQLSYFLRAEANDIQSWIEVRSNAGERPLAGAGHCTVRQGAGG